MMQLFAFRPDNTSGIAVAEKNLSKARRGQEIPDQEQWITASLNSASWEIRNIAVKICGLNRLKTTIPRLCEMLTDRKQNGFIRRNSADALRKLEDNSQPVLKALESALDDPYWEVRSHAAIAISDLALPDANLEAKILSKLFIRSVDTIQSVPIFRPKRIYREKNFEVRLALAYALGTIATDKTSIHALYLLTFDDYWKVRDAAIQALSTAAPRFGMNAEELHGLLKDIDLTCSDFKPTFPIRLTWNQIVTPIMRDTAERS